MGSQKRKFVRETESEDNLVSKAMAEYINRLEKERDVLLRENNKFRRSNKELKHQLESNQNNAKHSKELEMTNKNLKNIIERNGPRQVCPVCLYGATDIKILNRHFRRTNHGLPGMGALPGDDGDVCFSCGQKVKNLRNHQRSRHLETFKCSASEQLRLRESKIEDGDLVIECPNIYNPLFVASVRNDEDVPLAADTSNKAAELAEVHSSPKNYDGSDPDQEIVSDAEPAFIPLQTHPEDPHFETNFDTQQTEPFPSPGLNFVLAEYHTFIGPDQSSML